MKKLKFLAAMLVAGAAVFTLASCSGISQGYADKINEEAQDDDGKYITYDEVMKKLGDEAVDRTLAVAGSHSGIIYGVKGCKSWEDIQKKIDAGEDVEGLVITILANNATAAAYKKITGNES